MALRRELVLAVRPVLVIKDACAHVAKAETTLLFELR